MTVAQYEQHYQGWLGLAENGRIQKAKFVDMMVTTGGVDKEMAEILFDTYDSDGSGYVAALSPKGRLGLGPKRKGPFGTNKTLVVLPKMLVFLRLLPLLSHLTP